jgi:cysteinyl-tRNA synthetase
VFLDRAERRLSGTRFEGSGAPVIPEAFRDAMDDDLSLPQALAVLHERVRSGNAALDGEDLAAVASIRGEVTAMTEVVGINPSAPEWSVSSNDSATTALASLVERLIEDRATARSERNFDAADRIRDELAAAGITVEDTPTGAHWSINS